ncbi:hypothetical protein D9615_002865 [Tricholomella constricta]|uniref:Zn(2)-C6 fungal-type domain-containing protein n=1 Tax=Tricholomella constricta TaxID=117010 RepID=A0A8H5HG48_9AGAR|nr:hypothetical protein D9615_002865 [Tricholomella constricta]
MERRNNELRQSSLPSSLIPHLYSRPQQGDSLATTPFPTTLPLPSSTGAEEEADFTERTELPSMRASFALPPVASSFATPLRPVDTHRSPPYLNHEPRQLTSVELNPNIRTVSPVDVPASGIVRSMGSLSLPSHIPGQRYASPIYSDPHYHATRPERMFRGVNQIYPAPVAQDVPHHRGSWREGEAGPSSLVHAPYDSARSRGRRGSSQPAQLTRQTETFNHRDDVSDGDGEGYPSRGREGYPGASGHLAQRMFFHVSFWKSSADLEIHFSFFKGGSLYSTWPEPYQGSATHVSQPGPDLTSSHLSAGYSQFPLISVGASQGAWAGTPAGSGFGEHPPGYSPNSVSDVSSDGRPDDDGDDTYTTAQKGKKRRRDSDVGDSTRKTRNPRKTAVACNFCRGKITMLIAEKSVAYNKAGRKLRCNGAKPACSNCTVRRFQCEYVPVQRRRGPGKAPKGTKTKKSSTGRSEPSTSLPPGDRGSGHQPETTELTPMTLETFSFQSSERSSPKAGSSRRRGRGSRSPSADSDAGKRY